MFHNPSPAHLFVIVHKLKYFHRCSDRRRCQMHINLLFILHFNKMKFPIISPYVLIISNLSLLNVSIAVPRLGPVELWWKLYPLKKNFLFRLLTPDLFDSEFNLVSLSNIMSALDLVRHSILCKVESFTVLRLKLLTFCALIVNLGKLLTNLICPLLFSAI